MYELRLFLFIGIYSFGTYLCGVKPKMQGFALPVCHWCEDGSGCNRWPLLLFTI